MGRHFRCVGEVSYTPVDPSSGQKCHVNLSQNSEAWSFLQSFHPLSPNQPAFSILVKALGPQSSIVVGIAGASILENTPPGHWNNTVGYHSDTGRCYSSHDATANTVGETFGIGDKIKVRVSYFGKTSSTVVFYKNDNPIATRYLFSSNHSHYFPCVYLDRGPVELEAVWAESFPAGISDLGSPKAWVSAPSVTYHKDQGLFSYDKQQPEAFIQSIVPLGKDLCSFTVTVGESSVEGVGPTVAIASCSPLKPTPPCPLLRDYLKWEPAGRLQKGDHIGWGVHHSPDRRDKADFDPLAEQIVLCYVLKNQALQCFQMMVQPAGGLYPLVLLNQKASQISVKNGSKVEPDFMEELDRIYRDLLPDIKDMLETDTVNKRLTLPMLRLSEALNIDISQDECHVRLPAKTPGVHTVQFLHPLSKDNSYFYIEVNKLSGPSWVSVGVAGQGLSLSNAPGTVPFSVGISSQDGCLLHDNRSLSNMQGEKFSAGDKLGVQISCFAENVAVVLFLKNDRPIGTCYLTERDRNRYLPTVAMCSAGQDVHVNIVWQTRVERAPLLSPVNLCHWCLPQGSTVIRDTLVVVPSGGKKCRIMQSPVSLQKGFNHFEIQLVDHFDDCFPPPIIALCAACPKDPPSHCKYSQDFIRFWATGRAASAVSQGDFIGWGLLTPDPILGYDKEWVVCYLTVNRTIVLSRVLKLPPGGFYPVVILPPDVERVKFEFAACSIEEDPLSTSEVEHLLKEAQKGLKTGKDNSVLPSPEPSTIKPVSKHRRTNSTGQSLNSEGLSDEDLSPSVRKFSFEATDSPASKRSSKGSKGKSKSEKKDKKSKKNKDSVGKSGGEIKLQQSGTRTYQDEDIVDQYQSKSCIIL